ncbi:hypothetical protein FJZ31_31990 [Candidatus Poribacteria bacterium]|nr:hypothetical protein [Candidatus Poribacteria bacterium]
MNTAFWLTIQLERKLISLPLPIILPLVFLLEILAILPITFYAIVKKKKLLLRLAYGFYLSRLMLVFILHGRGFKIFVGENNKKVQIVGCRKC